MAAKQSKPIPASRLIGCGLQLASLSGCDYNNKAAAAASQSVSQAGSQLHCKIKFGRTQFGPNKSQAAQETMGWLGEDKGDAKEGSWRGERKGKRENWATRFCVIISTSLAFKFNAKFRLKHSLP